MIGRLRQLLAAAQTAQRLRRLAAGAPAAAPLSLRLDLGRGERDWLELTSASLPFWYRARPRHREYRLGIGHALQVTSAGPHRFAALDNAAAGFRQAWRHEGQALAFTGFAFAAEAEGPLPNAVLSIPAILLESRDGQCTATLSLPAGRHHAAAAEWRQWLDRLRPDDTRQAADLLPPASEMLSDQAWLARCQAALRAIADGRAAKLVLTRSRRLDSRRCLAPAAILARLLVQQPDSLCYAFGNGQQVFLGATPERLVRLQHGRIDADALAGTAWADSPALAGAKNRHEQALVADAICAALVPLVSAPPTSSSPHEQVAGHLRHLRSCITANARPTTSLFDLLAALHPTPAVGGHPTAAALAWLAAHGEQRSGWYSGGIGYMDQDGDGEISVALRSALLDGRMAILQAGAGIVTGSDPANELAETEAKLGTIMAALVGGGERAPATGTR